MSDISASAPAGLIAQALCSEAAKSAAHRRMFLGDYLGIPPVNVFNALMEVTPRQRVVINDIEGPQIEAVVDDRSGKRVLLIPYLVTEPGDSGQNRGSEGFAALLRGRFRDDAQPEEIRVLLVLHDDPVETIRTAAEDAAALDSLAWGQLCKQAARLAPPTSPAASLVEAVADDLTGLARGSSEILEALAVLASTRWRSGAEAGRNLWRIAVYVADPGWAAGDLTKRLKDSKKWRQDLDRWSEPGSDFQAALRQRMKLGDADVVDAILDSVGPEGLSYEAFTLDELDAAKRTGAPYFARPVRGFRAAMSCENGIAAWFGLAGGDLVVGVPGRLDGSVAAEIVWIDGARQPGTVTPTRQEAAFAIPGQDQGWRFGTLVLLRKGRSLAEVSLAAYFAEATWFPVEGARRIDVEKGAFVVVDEASAYLVSSPKNLGRIELDTSGLMPDTRGELVVTRNLEKHVLPVYLVGTGSEGPGDGLEITDEEPEPVTIDVLSPVHAMFRAASGALEISERGDPPSAQLDLAVATQPFRLKPCEIDGVDVLELERTILLAPDTWTFVLGGGGSQIMQADPKLERLPMESIPAANLREFRAARTAFFGALTVYGTAYAAGDPAVRGLAEAYVGAYKDLLMAIPEPRRGNPEFDRCILLDTVATPDAEQRYMAPTHPLLVAFYLAFWDFGVAWCQTDPPMLAADLGSISPAGLLPLIGVDGSWFEPHKSDGFLWLSYRRIDDSLPVLNYSSRFIAKKLKFFLTVHPAYASARQTLSICLFEPGDGAALVEALQIFYASDLKEETEYTLPIIELTLITPRGETPAAVNELLAAGQGRPIDRLVRSRVQVSVRSAHADHLFANMPDFCHLTFVHKTNTARHPGPVELGDRASTFYVGGLASSPGRLARRIGREHEFFWGAFGTKLAGRIDSSVQSDFERIAVRMLEVVGSQHREMLQSGRTRMLTMTADPDFMLDVYERSVWVVHLERLVGLELFAPDPGRPQRYIIDYEESFAGQGAVDGITATEDIGPYRNALRKALSEFDISPEAMDELLNMLNAIAGSWALQLLHSSPADILEKVGIVAAAAVVKDLDRSFDLRGGHGVLLSSEELFEAMPRDLPRPDSSKSDDLIFLWVPYSSEPRVYARVIEVKFSTTGSADLTKARQQLANTCDWLENAFVSGGPGHLFRSRDLAELIRAAASRNSTFRLAKIEKERPEFEQALEEIASGRFTFKCGFWIDGEKLAGEVISVEMESTAGVVRTGLKGAGPACGLVRIGRAAIRDLADGRPATADGPWSPVTFTPGAARAAGKESRPPERPEERREEVASGPGRAMEAKAGPSNSVRPATGLSASEEAELLKIARELDAAVVKYGLELEPFRPQLAQVGPSVIRFRSKPLGKQALDGIIRRAADLGREVGAPEGVLVAQEPYYIVVDVPRRERQIVNFSDHVDALVASQGPGALNFLLGIAPSGAVDIEDIARLPHLLIAGATGSGKSILLRSILCSLLLMHPPDELKIFLIDPKQIDFIPFEEAPHLVGGAIVVDARQAVADLQENIELEIGRRRPILRRAGVSNALEFYESGGSRKELPQMVIMVDEFAELAAGLDPSDRVGFMSIIQRYGQLTRAYGIYLVLATQRPSVQVITGDIKANLTARIALKLLTSQDSMTILGHSGAESLRDKGDLIFEHGGRRERLQGFLVRPADVSSAVSRWRG